MNCPKYLCEKRVESVFVKGIQRYKCKGCGYNCTVELKSTAKPKSMKKQALQLYFEAPGFRSIGRISGISNVSVLNWIRNFEKEGLELIMLKIRKQSRSRLTKCIPVPLQKNYCWILVAVDRYGKRFLHFVIGDRSRKSFEKK